MLRAIDINQTIPHYEFAELVDKYGDPIYKFCRSLTYSKEDADDLFQETFLRAFEQLAKINASNNPQSFLFSTTSYLWKSWKRKYARRNRLAPVEPLNEAVTQGTNMDDSFVAQEEIHNIRKLVDALPDKLKIPIILYYTIEMSVPEIASTLELPIGTIKSRLFTARKLIEKGLIEHEE